MLFVACEANPPGTPAWRRAAYGHYGLTVTGGKTTCESAR